MELGIVGLGRMGANLTRRLQRAGHTCVVYDIDSKAVELLEQEGAKGATSLDDLKEKLSAPRGVWVMLPAGEITGATVTQLSTVLEPDDVIIDGGNSYYRDDIARAAEVQGRGIHYLDIGTSGGVWGLERGFCLMIGGEAQIVERLRPVLEAIAPGFGAVERTIGRTGEPTPAERGYFHCGPTGAGHFVKMVHNGIEYGMMASFAEGLNVLKSANVGSQSPGTDAETAPLEHPEYYQYDFDLAEVTEVWRRGSVVASWLLDLTAAAFAENPGLSEFSGRVSDSGEGRWTSIAAVEEGVPAPVLTAALFSRFASRDLDRFANQSLSAMRKGFGGHLEKAPQ